MRLLALFLAALSTLSGLGRPLSAQESRAKESFTLDHVLGSPAVLRPKGLPGLKWHPQGDRFTFLEGEGSSAALVARPVAAGEDDVILRMQDLAPLLKDVLGKEVANPAVLTGLEWGSDSRGLRLLLGNTMLEVELDPLAVRRKLTLPEGASEPTFAPGERQAACVKDFNVQVVKTDGTLVEVTHGGYEDLTHGVSVSRVEFGIKDGLWWDPEGRRLAFYREDFRPVEPYPYVDFAPRPAKAVKGRYPMAGRGGSLVSVGIYDSRDDSVVWLQTDPQIDEYLTNVTWHPSGERLLVAHVNRDQDRMDLVEYEAATGKRLRLLFTEEDQQWVEPEHGPIFLPDGSGSFLWISFRDGHRHLHLHAPDGTHLRPVTSGLFDLSAFRGWDSSKKGFFFEASGPDPRQQHLFHASLTGEQRQITSGRGRHQTLISPDGSRLLDAHTNLELPLAIDLVDVREGKVLRRVHQAGDPLERFRLGEDRLFTAKTEDGQDLHGYLILPPGMKEGGKYPVIHYVYGGPHSQLVQDSWLGGASRWNYWLHFMAGRGYVVFILDGRGTSGRGIEWQQAVHRRLGTLEVQDQVRGLEQVLALGPADPERVGVTGWSYGGFMTLSLMTREGQRYRAGVAGAPVTDWAYYETGYGERYMDRPEENPEGYEEANPATHLKGLKGRLLVVQGTSDETVMWQSSLDFLRRCVEAGVPVDYMAYPAEQHGLRGKAFGHFLRKLTDYFDLHLRGAVEETGG